MSLHHWRPLYSSNQVNITYPFRLFNTFSSERVSLKTLDTIGNNCQRLVCSLGVSQHMHKITNLWKLIELNRSLKLRDNNERKNTLVTRGCVLSDCWFWDLKRSRNQFLSWKITSFPKTTLLQREPFLILFNSSPLLVTK